MPGYILDSSSFWGGEQNRLTGAIDVSDIEVAASRCTRLLRVEAGDDMDSRCPQLWIVPSMKNTWDWNYETNMYPRVDVRT